MRFFNTVKYLKFVCTYNNADVVYMCHSFLLSIHFCIYTCSYLWTILLIIIMMMTYKHCPGLLQYPPTGWHPLEHTAVINKNKIIINRSASLWATIAISRYGDDTTNYFTPCAYARGNDCLLIKEEFTILAFSSYQHHSCFPNTQNGKCIH